MFALGRLPGWISQWKEMREDPKWRIYRPRQIYTGRTITKFEEKMIVSFLHFKTLGSAKEIFEYDIIIIKNNISFFI